MWMCYFSFITMKSKTTTVFDEPDVSFGESLMLLREAMRNSLVLKMLTWRMPNETPLATHHVRTQKRSQRS